MKSFFTIFLLISIAGISNAQKADLELYNITNLTTTASIGDHYTFSFKVRNSGTVTAPNSHSRIVLARNIALSNPITIADISCESIAPGGESQWMNVDVILPYTVYVGPNILFVLLDSRNEVDELNEVNSNYTPTTITINSPVIKQHIPFPVIMVHGLVSDNTTWDTLKSHLRDRYGYSYGGNMNFCLNQDRNLSTSNKATDYRDWTIPDSLKPADFYTINFNVDTFGHTITNSTLSGTIESNQAGIVKQGLAVRDAISHVRQVTGRDKVILVCHSMGGLASREYLQNSSIWQPDGKHHVAKLFTAGTPHGGSNLSGWGLSSLIGIDEYSEAVRDLRTDYYWSGAPGVYLFGGKEDYSVMYNSLFYDFNNADVNCNGIDNDKTTITGLNQKTIPTDLAYTCMIGDWGIFSGDAVVSTTSANLNNFRTVNADTLLVSSSHTSLPAQTDILLKGMDEPFKRSFAYSVITDSLYYGNFTYPSVGGTALADSDYYSFSLVQDGNIAIELYNIAVPNVTIQVFNNSGTIVYSNTSNGKGYLNFNTIFLNAGNYYLSVTGIPDATSWLYPYAFRISFTPPVVVPVTLISFTGKNIYGMTNFLQWNCTENDMERFELESSEDGLNWTIIDKQSAKNLGTLNQYSYTDHLTVSSMRHYRLKLVQRNGQFSFSKQISIRPVDKQVEFSVQPNPANNNISIRYDLRTTLNAQLGIYDMQGVCLLQKSITGSPSGSIMMNITSLPPGIYAARLVTVNGSQQVKFTVNR